MKLGLNRIATQKVNDLQAKVDKLSRVGRMANVPVGNLSATSYLKTRGAAISFLVNSLEGVDSFALLRNFSQDIGSAQIVAIWPRSSLLSTPQRFPVAVHFADSDSAIAGKVAYYWLKAIPASNKTTDNVFISGPQVFDASQFPSATQIQGDFPVTQSLTPLTSPITADTGGSPNTATINVAAFSVQYPFGLVHYNSGMISGLLDSTGYFVYSRDPAYKGGPQTYIATVNNPDLTASDPVVFHGSVTTPVFGAGPKQGGGGGNGPCFDPETKVITQKGDKPFEEIKAGEDMVLTRVGWRRVKCVLIHDYDGPLHEMPDGGLVTPEHRIRKGYDWVRAADLFKNIVHYAGPVYNMHVEGATDDERCYRLANGYLAHNTQKQALT